MTDAHAQNIRKLKLVKRPWAVRAVLALVNSIPWTIIYAILGLATALAISIILTIEYTQFMVGLYIGTFIGIGVCGLFGAGEGRD